MTKFTRLAFEMIRLTSLMGFHSYNVDVTEGITISEVNTLTYHINLLMFCIYTVYLMFDYQTFYHLGTEWLIRFGTTFGF